MKINWEKRHLEYRDLSNPYVFNLREDGMCEGRTGLISFPSKKQNLTLLEKYICEDNEFYEYIIGTVDTCKFPLSFEITFKDGKYKLTSCSHVSLRTYELLSFKIENWGEFETIDRCMNKAMSVIKGFQVYFLSGKENDGEYFTY